MSLAPTTLADARDRVRTLLADVQPHLDRVDDRLRVELSSQHPMIDRVLQHGVRLGGKRLRPALVLLAGEATGGVTEGHVTLATVMEMIHTATLVHDDVLDEASLRRHEDTVNARWGNETSVLLGDFLFSHAFTLASTLGDAGLCRAIGKATNTVCEGELRQTLSGGDTALSEADYFAIIEAKTAALCACCCELGARWSGAEEATVGRLSRFGMALGVAFQIADDLLDLVATEAGAGKTVGADLAKRKLTLPVIHARDSLVNGPRQSLLGLLEKGDNASRRRVVEHLESVGAFGYAQQQAERYADLAAAELEGLPPSPAVDSLRAMARFSVRRSA
ncbi:Octaprenyl-diphosphate synthase [Pirellulimonas nuda]|uniref:Octaprenyl-diphosphate synthase n=1 Tax=Pirellulimonas nuda TaxID=2528009 RepID=A0A518DGI2_9BACT|nr:polyprenyl synthetase family protein [Pirellulimonas nuda]QDU90579.1 Octaprenyl-diphosphate synthase [Pirellulimonas nuda]